MGFDKRNVNVLIPSPAATASTTLNLRSTYVRPIGFNILLTGTDVLVKLKLTDKDSRVFYLDAADKDYKTARIHTALLLDDVTTGLGPKAFDAVGAAVAATQHSPMPVIRSPIEVEISNGGTAGDSIDFNFEYEYGVFGAATFTMPVAASSASTKVVSLATRYARVLGFRARSVGTSVTQKFRITDADSKIVYLDAAAQDYDTAELDKVLIYDATVTGLTGVVPRNATGATIQAGVGRFEPPMVRSPITFDLLESEGNDEVVTATIYYKTY